MTKKRLMVKPGGMHTGPGFRLTMKTHGRQSARLCARCGKKTTEAKHGLCPECHRKLGRWA